MSSTILPDLHRPVPQHLPRRFAQICNALRAEAFGPHEPMPGSFALLSQIHATPGMDRNWLARATGFDATSTGQALRVRAAMKPISTVPRALATVDLSTGEQAVAIHQRSDVCAVPAAGVVVETMVALVLARAALEKFGGDSLAETRRNIDGYLRALSEREAVADSNSVRLSG
jgi:hypothetical protein